MSFDSKNAARASSFDAHVNAGGAPAQPTGRPAAQRHPDGRPNLNLNDANLMQMSPGGFWRRFVACMVDNLILGVATGAAYALLSAGCMAAFGRGEGGALIVTVLSIPIYLGATYAYYGWFYANKGGSPGKLLMGLRVMRAQTGAPMTYMRTLARETVGKLISYCLFMIGFIMAGFRADKRALHDLLADSQVMRVRDGGR